jgi:putative endonuclease
MPSEKQQIGTRGELMAQKYLEEQGFRLLEKQWHSRYGEIDLIMMDRDELVFVEVKLRKTEFFGRPEEMVSRSKGQRLSKTALSYIESKELENVFWRFDTIAITLQRNHYEIFHLTDTIREDSL